ncbi:hypothetical protein GA0115252_126210 [Streptomyces sp. DfronAA-171]|nr:hypothetical protein GA0115252_126210 [Streptomyces sp. DfronAA-171]
MLPIGVTFLYLLKGAPSARRALWRPGRACGLRPVPSGRPAPDTPDPPQRTRTPPETPLRGRFCSRSPRLTPRSTRSSGTASLPPGTCHRRIGLRPLTCGFRSRGFGRPRRPGRYLRHVRACLRAAAEAVPTPVTRSGRGHPSHTMKTPLRSSTSRTSEPAAVLHSSRRMAALPVSAPVAEFRRDHTCCLNPQPDHGLAARARMRHGSHHAAQQSRTVKSRIQLARRLRRLPPSAEVVHPWVEPPLLQRARPPLMRPCHQVPHAIAPFAIPHTTAPPENRTPVHVSNEPKAYAAPYAPRTADYKSGNGLGSTYTPPPCRHHVAIA